MADGPHLIMQVYVSDNGDVEMINDTFQNSW